MFWYTHERDNPSGTNKKKLIMCGKTQHTVKQKKKKKAKHLKMKKKKKKGKKKNNSEEKE